MKPILSAFLMMGLSMMADMKTQQEQRKEEILAKWEETKNMPRKMKKRVRKELQLDYSIACWNPFEDLNF